MQIFELQIILLLDHTFGTEMYMPVSRALCECSVVIKWCVE